MTQPDPVPNSQPFVGNLAIEFIRERMALGESRYGVKLQPHNGRDALTDAIEEAADLLLYLLQFRYERDNKT